MRARLSLVALLDYNLALIGQGKQVARGFLESPATVYAAPVGAHLRHVIEHYEAFLGGLPQRVVNYDARARDARLEASAAVAIERFEVLAMRLAALRDGGSPRLAVVLVCGLLGEDSLVSRSSMARELQFLASHTVHHYAILAPDLKALGRPLPTDFGKAPGTVRHERAQR